VASSVVERDVGDETEAELLERRWFAVLSAISSLKLECGILLEASKLADMAWRRANAQLAEFEALQAMLEDHMSKHLPARQTSAA
jgi:hypothetical protein